MRVLFVASEGGPFIKTGGLGEVIGSLPKALRKTGIDVRVILPKYKDIPQHYHTKMRYINNIIIPLGWRKQYCGLFKLIHEDVTYYFIDNEYYFKRDGIYGFYDDAERFAFYNRAVLEALPHLDFKPDVLHCHDWHTGMVSMFLKVHYSHISFYQNIRTAFTIHNLKYQGIFPKEILSDILALDESYFTPDGIEYYGQVNYMKGGLIFSDIITTVSNTYVFEIQTPYFGEGMDGVLRNRQDNLFGIINGIDYEEYNPMTDKLIFKNYDQNSLQFKKVNKQKLQMLLGLPEKDHIPIVAIVSRLVSQKGLDLIIHLLDEILETDIQMVIIGNGEKEYENNFKEAQTRYPEKISANIHYNSQLAHRIYAGSDMFLMPSRFEPCGLGQLIALRYGCIPIVRETGGLNDTIQSYNEINDTGNGFSFKNFNAHDMLYTIKRAVKFYHQTEIWNNLVKKAMSGDYSWNISAKKYLELYQKLIQ
ncbi:MAG: glycogen synthase GlgA [Firmicutes bacterium]|nr:glycogen synthase GlgA [Bacillota bacterium]